MSWYLVAYYYYNQMFQFFPGENWNCMRGKHLCMIVKMKTAPAWLVMSKTVASVGAEVCQGQVFHSVAML